MRYLIVAVMATGLTAHSHPSVYENAWGWENLHADTSCGIIWDEPILLSDSTYESLSPQIALSGDDTIHVTWAELHAQHLLPYIRSVTGGSFWEPIRDIIVDTVQFPAPMFQTRTVTDGDNVYVFAQRGQIPVSRNVMSKSTDRGSTWITQYVGIDTAAGLYSANARNDTLILHYQKRTGDGANLPPRLMYSTDAGLTWHERPDTLKDNSKTALTEGTLHLVENVIMASPAGTAPEIVHRRSFNLGETWQDADTLSQVDGEFAYETGMAASNNDSVGHIVLAWRDGIACAAMAGCTILERESGSNGAFWMNPEALTDVPRGLKPSVAISPTGVVAVSWTDEVALTQLHTVIRVRANKNSPWCPIFNLSPTSSNVGGSCVAVGRRAIHVVWSQYFPGEPKESFRIVYRRGRFIDTNVKEEPTTPPPFARLEQNYPNPFNPSTKIAYGVMSRESVSLKVFDVLGREVATLVNENKEPGEHTVEWNPSASSGQALSSGVYYYRLVAGGRIETRKAVLIR